MKNNQIDTRNSVSIQETKKQHFLPFVYLKYFRCHEDVATRENATIWRDDGKTVTEEKVENQCYANYFYRKKNTKESEEGFGAYETDWDECVLRARAGKAESALLLLQMVVYHFRNISIRALKDDVDRYNLVLMAAKNFLEQKILRLSKGVEFTDNSSHVTQFPWLVRLIKFESPLLLTSDNPSVMTITTKKSESYGPFFIPVSPTELMVGIDKSKFRFCSTKGTDADACIANAAVASQSSRHIYTSEPMDNSVRESLWRYLKKHQISEQERGAFYEKNFIPAHPVYEKKFSFVMNKPSLKLDAAVKQLVKRGWS